MRIRKEDMRKALRCCRVGDCTGCPLLGDLCDELLVTMASVPVELLDMIDEILAEEQEPVNNIVHFRQQ